MYNPDDYRHLKLELLQSLNKSDITEQSVSSLSSMIGVPLTVLYTFIKEDYPDLQEMADYNINRLNDFYGNN